MQNISIDATHTHGERPQRVVQNAISRRELFVKGLQVITTTAGAHLLLDRNMQNAPVHASFVHTTITPDTLVVAWNNAALQMIRTTHPGPPITARALAIVHTCMYDAWAAYDPQAAGTRLGTALRRPQAEHTLAHKHKAVSYAAYRALADLYPQAVAQFNALMHDLGYDPRDTSTDISTPSGIGNVAARAVLEFRHNDGSNQLGNLHPGPYSEYLNYVPINTPDNIVNPNKWQPLRVADGHQGQVVQKYTTACCGLIMPFALSSTSQFRPAAPATYPSPEYVAQAEQILNYSAHLSDEQKVIAEYWADGPASEQPPGHWNLLAQFVSKRDGYDLDTNVKLFFILTNALFDAGIAAWDCKLYYNSVRPVTAIHFLFNNKSVQAWAGPFKGTQLIQGQDWLPYQAATVVTPPFPEHISGHSTFSASAAEILKRFTSSDSLGFSHTVAAKSSLFEPGLVPAHNITLSYPTFSDAANAAGISRRYGGIHFQNGDLSGRTIGRLVAQETWHKAQAAINGTLHP